VANVLLRRSGSISRSKAGWLTLVDWILTTCPEPRFSFVIVMKLDRETYVRRVCDNLFDADYSRHCFNRRAGRICRKEIFF
jgi:hypothetical protein